VIYSARVPRRGEPAPSTVFAALIAGVVLIAPLARAGAPTELGEPPEASIPSAEDPLLDEFDRELAATEIPDPMEPMNRGVFAGNRVIDRVLLDPVTKAYGRIVPGPVKRAVRGVFDNLNQPVVIANDLLQLEPRRAGSATARFLLNTTFGWGGIFDPALEAGFAPHHADFGQTLGRAGVGPGVYLVVPLLGPSTARDLVGSIVDMALRPDTWLLPVPPRLLLGGTWGISEREQHLESLEALEQSSVDFYSAIRSAYWMSREAFVKGEAARPEPRPAEATTQALAAP
jgi:phospholipid-binding lipoprotein MlaA